MSAVQEVKHPALLRSILLQSLISFKPSGTRRFSLWVEGILTKERLKHFFHCFLILSWLATASAQYIQADVAIAQGQSGPSLSKPFYVRWAFETDRFTNLTPAINGGKVYVAQTGGIIMSLSYTDGKLTWKSEMGGEVSAAPLADSRGLYVASESSPSKDKSYYHATGVLRMMGNQSGVTLWMRTLPSPLRGSLASNEGLLFGCDSDGYLFAFKKQSGEVAWVKYISPGFIPSPVTEGDVLYICDRAGIIYSIDQTTGQTLWRYRTRKSLRTPIAVIGGILYTGSSDGSVYAIDLSTKRLKWHVRTGAAVQSLLPAGRCLLTTSLDNFVYCLAPESGAKTWKRQMPGRVEAEPLVQNDGALLSPISGDECVVLSLDDGRKINSVYVGEDNNTEASPLLVGDLLLLTTRKGLYAYSNQPDETIDKAGSNGPVARL